MGFGLNLGGLWKPKSATAKAAASGAFTLPAVVALDASKGHRFVVTLRKKNKANEPDFDLWLFGEDEQQEPEQTGASLGPADEQPTTDDVPF